MLGKIFISLFFFLFFSFSLVYLSFDPPANHFEKNIVCGFLRHKLKTPKVIRGHVDEFPFFFGIKNIHTLSSQRFVPLSCMALEEISGNMGKKKEKGLFRFVLWNGGKNPPHA